MVKVTAAEVNKLRKTTGAGMMDCKNALTETNGDLEKAIDHLRKTGISKAEKKGIRETKDGLVYSYIHAGGRLGVLLELNCETDFVAKTETFSDLAHHISMQIAATNPISIDHKSISEKVREGKFNKFFQENCLLEQAYIKDPEKKVKDLLTESIATLGENIGVSRFVRFAIGESDIPKVE